MHDSVIISLDQVTPEWLTAVLTSSGALARGQVATFDINAGGGNWSSNGALRLRYSADAQGALPERLFLKMVDTDLGDGEFFGPSEVDYYTRDYLGVPDAPLIRCYHGAYSPELQRYHLLLDDLSETHSAATDLTPTLEYGLALAEGLAALHAHWWGAKRLAEIGAPIHNAAHIQRFIDIARPGAEHILARFTPDLEPHWPGLIHDLYARHPRALIERTQDDNGFTLIHGDAGCTNILAPVQGERPIYLIDRQPFDWSLTTWLGAYDLAYAMVLDWEVELRRKLETPVLRRYHEALQQRGVTGYSWQRLWDDYRLCAAMGVYIATEYCRGGVNERYTWVWLPMLQRSLAACDDLDCQALW
jgi:hypothetical protein